jgi:hypothetical protein
MQVLAGGQRTDLTCLDFTRLHQHAVARRGYRDLVVSAELHSRLDRLVLHDVDGQMGEPAELTGRVQLGAQLEQRLGPPVAPAPGDDQDHGQPGIRVRR